MCRALCCAGNYLLVTLQQQQQQSPEEESLELHQQPEEDSPEMGLKHMFGFNEMQSEEPELNQEQKEELYEAFKLFKSRKDKMSVLDIGEFLRCIGWNPSESDLEEAMNELEINGKGEVYLWDLERYVARRSNDCVTGHERTDLLAAFNVLDKTGGGRIRIKDFRRFMTTLGDKMAPDEVEELLKEAKSDDTDFIEVKDLLEAMSLST
ncbi:calmodulin-like [Argonauta hians]